MKKLLFCLTLLILPVFLFSQSQIIRAGKTAKNIKNISKAARTARSIGKASKVPIRYAKPLSAVKGLSELKAVVNPRLAGAIKNEAQITAFLERAINLKKVESELAALNYNSHLVPMLAAPEESWGSYASLRRIARMAKQDPKVLNIQPVWYKIWKTEQYNGAHHIMNKYAIKQIWHTSPLAGKVDYNLVIRDAPGMFHELHGSEAFLNVFHNADVQVLLYRTGGVKAVMENQLFNINALNIERGLPQLSESFLSNTMKYAQKWAKDYQLRWN